MTPNDIQITATDALLIIDPQNDFCPGGALAVEGGHDIMVAINAFSTKFATIVITQDWHPAGHKSFASANGAEPFSEIDVGYGKQTMWPDHCVQGSPGADIHRALQESVGGWHNRVGGAVERASLIIRKGMNPEIDSYSAFYENDRATATGLAGYLRDKGIKRVFVVGLAYDFCVAYTALDAVTDGFESIVIRDLTRAIAMPVKVPTQYTDDRSTDADSTTEEVMTDIMQRSQVTIIEGAVA